MKIQINNEHVNKKHDSLVINHVINKEVDVFNVKVNIRIFFALILRHLQIFKNYLSNINKFKYNIFFPALSAAHAAAVFF